jgi:hypothetical protein
MRKAVHDARARCVRCFAGSTTHSDPHGKEGIETPRRTRRKKKFPITTACSPFKPLRYGRRAGAENRHASQGNGGMAVLTK